MKIRRLLAITALGGLMASSTAQMKVFPYPYEVADYVSGPHELRIFQSKGQVVTIALPFRINRAAFGPDGKSVYGIIGDTQRDVGRDRPGLSRIEFNPVRATPVAG